MKKGFIGIAVIIISLSLLLFACGKNNDSNITINFDSNGGSSVGSISLGTEMNISMPENPTKEGYIFSGWYWDNNSFQQEFTPGSLLTVQISQNMTVYARWVSEAQSKEKFTVTFYSEGGSEIDPISVEFGNLLMEPTAPVRQGYYFAGWFRDGLCLNKWDFSSDKVVREITLYAKWNMVDPTGNDVETPLFLVSFYVNDTLVMSEKYAEGTKIPVSAVINHIQPEAMQGYTIEGWYTSKAYTKRWSFEDDVVKGVTNLYVKLEKILVWITNETHHWHEDGVVISDKSEHNWDEGIVTQQPTETTPGIRKYTCSVCEKTKTESIPRIHVHTFSSEWTYDENEHWQACTGCDEVRDKAEHEWDDGIITLPATEDDFGERTYTCQKCHATQREAIDKLPHVHKYEEKWTNDNDYHWHASVCGHENEISDKAQHKWDVGVVVEELSNDDGITIKYTCLDCMAIKNEVVPKESLTVTFKDYDDTILSKQWVLPSGSAEAPIQPFREGYRFDKWDKSFDDVQGDLVVYANYVKVFTVEFIDYDGLLIAEQIVDENTSAKEPEDPLRNGYRFTGWKGDYGCIIQDTTMEAEYIKQYNVTFLDFYGKRIEDYCYLVDEGCSFGDLERIPEVPKIIENYRFDKWDNEFENIFSDQTISALYYLKTYDVTFLMPDDTIIETKKVSHGFPAETPNELPAYYYSKTDRKIRAFTGWDVDTSNITEDIFVKAVYKDEYDQPVLFIEYVDKDRVRVSIQISHQFGLYSFDFTVNYEKNVSINDTNPDSIDINHGTYWLWKNGSLQGEDKLYNYNINNNTSSFHFAWANANIDEVKPNTDDGLLYDLFVINFERTSVATVIISPKTFNSISINAIVSRDDGKTFERIIPLIISIDNEGNKIE